MIEFFLHNILLRFLTCTISSHMLLLRVGMVLYAEETLKWRNITVAAYIACIALGVYTFAGAAHEHDDAEETLKWRNITVAAYIACIALGIYTFAGEEHHEASERQVMLQLTL
jgi:uncharacterized membrane protein YjjB (DUF3815 family)